MTAKHKEKSTDSQGANLMSTFLTNKRIHRKYKEGSYEKIVMPPDLPGFCYAPLLI